MPWKHLPDSPPLKKAWFSGSPCPGALPHVLHSPWRRHGGPAFTEVLSFSDDIQHGTLHQGTLIFPLPPSLPQYPSWDGPTGSSFGLPPPAMCVPYLCCIPTPSSPTHQLCGAVPPLQRVQPYIMPPTQKCFSASLYLRWVSLSTGIGGLRFSWGCCHCGPTGSDCSFVLSSL